MKIYWKILIKIQSILIWILSLCFAISGTFAVAVVFSQSDRNHGHYHSGAWTNPHKQYPWGSGCAPYRMRYNDTDNANKEDNEGK